MEKSLTQGFDLSSFSAAVIGCGGLGCNIAVHLAGAGIGKLLLADFDEVGETNLNRQFLYTFGDIGKPKVSAAAERLKKYAPDTDIRAYNVKIESRADLAFAESCSIVFLAADNNRTRKLVQEFCAKRAIPLVNGGICGFSGTAYLFVPGVSPCLDCAGLTEKENETVLSVSSTAGIIGALETEIGTGYLLGKCVPGILHIYDNGEINKLKIKPHDDCGVCGGNKYV